MPICLINNNEFEFSLVESPLNTISVDSVNAFSNVLECKIGSEDILLEKVGDVNNQPLVIIELNIDGRDYVTEAVLVDSEVSYIKINENNLHLIKKENENDIVEESVEETPEVRANELTEFLGEKIEDFTNKKLDAVLEEVKTFSSNTLYENIEAFEEKKKDLLQLVEDQFATNINVLKEDIDKKVDIFFKKTDLNNKTSIAIETDRLKDTINEKYKDFIVELKQAKELINEDTAERANNLIKLVEKKEKELKDSVKVFIEKIYTKQQQKLNPQIENILNENKLLKEKINKLESLKNNLVQKDFYTEDLSKSETTFKKLLKDTNKKFNKINEKFKILSEKDNKRYNSLLAAINDTDVKDYETVLSNKIEQAELGQIKEELEQRITNNMQNEMTSLKRYVEMSSSGGTNAMQFANGGKMTGNLEVTGSLSADTIIASTLLSATTLDVGVELSGFNVNGILSASNHILPTQNNAYDLGSSALRFREIYVSGDTINLGNTKLKTTSDGEFAVQDSGGSSVPMKDAKFKGIVFAQNDITTNGSLVSNGSSISGNKTIVSGVTASQDSRLNFLTAGSSNMGATTVSGLTASGNSRVQAVTAATIASGDATVSGLTASGDIRKGSDYAIINDESDSAPIRNIRRMTQSAYTSLSPKLSNTLYIIV